MLAVRLLLVVAVAFADDWSFKDFLVGEWDLERPATPDRQTPLERVTPSHAHYSRRAVGAALEGTYYEDGEDGKENEMFVRVLFDDPRSGQFQLAKKQAPKTTAADADDEPPTPQPMQPQAEPKTVFEFDFREQNGGRFHISQSKWNGKQGGTVQFLCSDDDAFVFSKVRSVCSTAETTSCSTLGSAWTAVRHGEARRKGSSASEPKTLLQRYGWYVFFGVLYFGYQAAKDKASQVAGQMGASKKTA